MNKTFVTIFIVLIAVVLVIIVAMDYTSTRPDRSQGNPYEYSVDAYRAVDPSLVTYEEVKQIRTGNVNLHGIHYFGGRIYLLADDFLQLLDVSGNQVMKLEFEGEPNCMDVDDERIAIGFSNYLAIFDHSGNLQYQSEFASDSSWFTSVAIGSNNIFIADAGKRRILIYDDLAGKTGEILGESGSSSLHGFIIPSMIFDLAVNEADELWAVNPGMLALQQYSIRGDLMHHREMAGIEIDGFSGCCNPAHIAFFPDGRLVTSEKGLVRIKIYDAAGTFESVVAAPVLFEDEGEAPDVAVDEQGNVYALDFDRLMIRIFEPV